MFFLVFFTGSNYFSRALFKKFSRVAKSFHGHFLIFFHGLNLKFHGQKPDFFSRVRIFKKEFFSWAEFYKELPTFFSNVFYPRNIECTRERNFLMYVMVSFSGCRHVFENLTGKRERSGPVSLTFSSALFHGSPANFRCSRALFRRDYLKGISSFARVE